MKRPGKTNEPNPYEPPGVDPTHRSTGPRPHELPILLRPVPGSEAGCLGGFLGFLGGLALAFLVTRFTEPGHDLGRTAALFPIVGAVAVGLLGVVVGLLSKKPPEPEEEE